MIEIIKSRRSCKCFSNKEVSNEIINEVIECGLMAPSAKNLQSPQFCVITNKEILNEIVELTGKNILYNAPVLIVVYTENDVKSALSDGACAISQMYLAAHSLGLGGCWINHLKNHVNDPLFSNLFERLGISDKVIVGSFVLGYAASKPKDKVVNYNRVRFIE